MMEDVNQRFESITARKPFHDDLLKKVKLIISDSIASNNFSKAVNIPNLYDKDKFILDSEFNRINTILLIYLNEKEAQNDEYFYQGTDNYDGLFFKYIKTTLMLRRVEMNFDEAFIGEAFEYLKTISPEAIITILDCELFEHREKIAISVFENLHSNNEINERIKWLCSLYKRYKEEWMLDEINKIVGNS